MRKHIWTVIAITAALLPFGQSRAGEVTLVEDVFGNRPSSNDLGLMSDGVHTWYEREPAGASSIRTFAAGGTFLGSMYVGQGNMGAAVVNFRVADGIIRFCNHYLQPMETYFFSNIGGLTYRADTLANATDIWSADAYHLAFFPPNSANNRPQRIVLSYGRYDSGITLADVILGTNWVKRSFEVHAEGDRHKVYVDGELKIDVVNTNRLAAGYVGFSHYSLSAHWQTFRVSYVPPDGTVVLIR